VVTRRVPRGPRACHHLVLQLLALGLSALGFADAALAKGPKPTPSTPAQAAPAAAEAEKPAAPLTPAVSLDEYRQRDVESLRFLEGLARRNEADKKFADAAAVYAHIGTLYPDDTYWPFKAAQMHAFAGEYDQAILLARAVREREPRNLDAGLLLARLYGWTGQWTQSDQLHAELEAAHPNEPAITKSRGDLLYYQGRYAEARVQYEKYLQTRTQDPEALRSLSKTYVALGETERAEALRAPLAEAGDTAAADDIDKAGERDDLAFRFDVSPSYSINMERPDWFGIRSTLGYTITEGVSIGAGFDLSSRRDIDATDVMILVVGGFRPSKRFTIDVELGFTPGADYRPLFLGRVVPRVSVVDWFDVFLFYQIMSFEDGVSSGNNLLVNQIGPGLGFHFGPVSIDLSYKATLFDEDSLDLGHLYSLDLRAQLHPQWYLLGSAAYGDSTEVFFDPAPVIRDTLTLVGGLEYLIDDRQGIRGIYTFFTTDPPREDPGGLYQHTITAHYWVRF
jgi:tetratricopeptide (TPR) repeat protein